MLQQLIDILKTMTSIDAYHILERKTSSHELFYIKENIDMNRFKDVHFYNVTLYKDFEENLKKFRGSSTTIISPAMNESEMVEVLEDAALAASFVKNPYYPLISKTENKVVKPTSNLRSKLLERFIPEFTQALFKGNDSKKLGLNSAELFLNKNQLRILNSQGLDVSYDHYDVNLEFITHWTEKNEAVESYNNLKFSDFEPELISQQVENSILYSKEKATARPTPSLEKFNVLLTGKPVITFFDYYMFQSNSRSVYQEISTFKLEDAIQGHQIKGDLVTITLDPTLEGSTFSKPFDTDGLPLEKTRIIENGILKKYWGQSRFGHYLNIEPTGDIRNLIISPGSRSIETMKAEPYLELLEFSDFQMDSLTGDFAGEIRIGRYYDGHETYPVTTGSISGNIKDVQEEMYLSKECFQDNHYYGPKSLQLLTVNVAGS
jgi:PmbA protein